MSDPETPAYVDGWKSREIVHMYGGDPEGVFLARIKRWRGVDESAEFEEGWMACDNEININA